MALPVTIPAGLDTTVTPVGPFRARTRLGNSAAGSARAVGQGGINSASYVSQGFVATENFTLTKVALQLYKTNAPTGTVEITLRTGGPVSTILRTIASVAGTSLGTVAVVTEYTLASPVNIVAGTQYYLTIQYPGANNNTNYFMVGAANASPYSGGIVYYGDNFNNSQSPGDELYFEFNGGLPATYEGETYYFFGARESGGTRALMVYKTNDPTTSFDFYSALSTTGNVPIYSMAAYQEGGIIHLITHTSGTVGQICNVLYHAFNTTTAAFDVSNEPIQTGVAMAGQVVAGAMANGTSIIVRANGDVIAFFNGTQTKASGTYRSRVYYSRRTAPATWSAPVQVDTSGAVDSVVPEVVNGQGGLIHFLFRSSAAGTAGTASQRALTAANALQTATAFTFNGPIQGISAKSYDRGSGVIRVVIGDRTNPASTGVRCFYFDSVASPTISTGTGTGTLASDPPVRLMVDDETKTIYGFCLNNSTSDLHVQKSIDNGVTCTTPAVVFAGTIARDVDAGLSANGRIYQRGDGSVVVPLIVNDAGAFKYTEYLVRYVAQADAWNANDRSANIALTNGDKTATVSASGASGVHTTQTQLSATAGKFYAEFKVDVLGGSIGMQMTATDETNGGFANSYYVTSNGNIWSSTQVVGNVGGALVAGDVVCLATDFGGKLYWFRKNEGLWNNSATADPATGVGGLPSYNSAVPFSLWFGGGVVGTNATVRTEIADLTLTPPASFKSWMGEIIPTADAWDARTLTPGAVVLSDADKTATFSTTGTARSTQSQLNGTAGLFYAEFKIGAVRPGYVGVQAISESHGSLQNEIALDPFGSVRIHIGNVATVAGYVANDTVGMAWNTGTELIWFRTNAGYWNNNAAANPATGVGGIDASAALNSAYGLYVYGNGAGHAVTVRTEKDEFTQTTPAGALSWMGETLTIPDAGTLACGAASVSGAGFATHHGTGTLVQARGTLTNPGGITGSTGTGALTAATISRKNALRGSEEIDVYATPSEVTITANTVAAPDSATTAETVTESLNNATHSFTVNAGVAMPAAPLTFSIYAKAGTCNWIQLWVGAEGVVNFNVQTGAVGWSSSATLAGAVTSVGNGWFRCAVTFAAFGGDSYMSPGVILLQGDTQAFTPSYVGTGKTVHLWGWQFESAPAATAYIKTTTTDVTIGSPLTGVGAVSWNATGVIVAGSRRNFVGASQAFDSGSWGKLNVVVAGDAALAPDGTMTAERITDNAVDGTHYINQTAIDSTGMHTVSLYAKGETLAWIQIQLASYVANFNVLTGALGQKTGGCTSAIENIGGGWYRCSISVATVGSGVGIYVMTLPSDTTFVSYAGTGKSVLFWGIQGERSDFATPYIATTSTGVTVGTPALLAGVGEVTTPPAIGVGTLTSLVATSNGFGFVRSVGTADLVAADRTMTGVGVSQVIATGVLVSVAAPRINLLTFSQAFDTYPWTPTAASVVPNVAVAPDATTTADRHVDNTANAFHLLQHGGVICPAGVLTYSVYAKADTITKFQMYGGTAGYWANFDLAAGTKLSTSGEPGVSSSILAVGDGWYRCVLVMPPGAGGSQTFYVLPKIGDTSLENYVGSGQGYFVWGAQVEAGAIATAYIPTTTDPVSVVGSPITGAGSSSSRQTSAALQATMPPVFLGNGRSSSTGTGALPSNISTIVGAGLGPAWVGFGVLQAMPQTPIEQPILDGAAFYVNFITNKGYVRGTGEVPISTLIGHDPAIELWWGTTEYYPSAHRPYGYHYAEVGNNPPALIGAMRDAVLLDHKTLVIKTSASGKGVDSFKCSIASSDASYGLWVQSSAETLNFWLTGADRSFPGGYDYSKNLGTYNAIAFHVIPSNRYDAGTNYLNPISAGLTSEETPPANPFVSVMFNDTVPIASIAVYDTLTPAELKEKTVRALDALVGKTLDGKGVAAWVLSGELTAQAHTTSGAGIARWSGVGALPAQLAAVAGVGKTGTTLGIGTLTSGLSKVQALGSAVTGVGGTGELIPQAPVLSPIDQGALVHVDFLANAGYVKGTGNVGIETLLGTDPNISGVNTGYNPAWITSYGYDVYANDGTLVPAFLGALLAGIVGGGSVVFKFQGRPDEGLGYDTEAFDLSIDNGAGVGSRNIWLMSDWTYLGAGSYNSMDQIEDVWSISPDVVINAVGFTLRPSVSFEWAGNDRGVLSFPLTDSDTPPARPMSGSYMDPSGPIVSITVFDRLSIADLKAQTQPKFYPLVSTKVVSGAGISGTYGGTGALTSSASLAGVGKVIATGSGVLVVPGVAAMAGVGVVRAVGTAALNAQAAVAVGAGIARHVATGTMPSTYATLAAAGSVVAGPEGTGTFVAQVAKVVASGVANHIATGALVDQVASITSTGNATWNATGAMPAGVAAVAGAGVSSSSVTAASLLAARSQVEGWEGVAVIAGTGAMVAQSHALASSGGVLTSGTGVLIDAAPALAGAGLTRSLGTGAPISQASVISGAGVSSVAGVGAIIPTTAAVISGAGIIIPAPSGTGALSSSVSAVAGLGVVERVMTGVLVAQNRTMSSTGGVSRTVGTGAILGTEAAAAGVAVGTSRGTGALVTFSALAGAGVSLVEGAGALSSGVAAVAGVAVATQLGSGALTSSSAAVSGAGFVQHVVVSAALAAQAAQVTAGGLSSSTATAPLQASRSTVQGVQGVMIGVGVGDLQAQSRLMAGAGLVRAIGTGSLSVADSFTVNAVGESDSSGSGVLGCSPSIIEATGKGDIEGTGELEAAGAVLASTGGSVRWAGTGELEAQDRKVVGAGRVIATGTGALQLPTVATVTGSGTTSSRGFGNMTSKRATIYGTAFLSTLGFGELQAQNRKLTGVGRVIAFGVGMLRQARPALNGDGLSFSRGTGAIKPRSAQIHAFGVETAYGEGDLVSLPVTISGSNLIEGDAVIDAAPAQIVGIGEVGAYVPAMPPDPPGSYPGTTTWAGYTRTPSQLPPPWWMRKAA